MLLNEYNMKIQFIIFGNERLCGLLCFWFLINSKSFIVCSWQPCIMIMMGENHSIIVELIISFVSDLMQRFCQP